MHSNCGWGMQLTHRKTGFLRPSPAQPKHHEEHLAVSCLYKMAESRDGWDSQEASANLTYKSCTFWAKRSKCFNKGGC